MNMVLSINGENFENEVLKGKGLVVVDFFADWCGPCKMMEPAVKKIAEEFEGTVKVGKLDVDANNEIASQFQIQSIPTILFFKDGEVVGREIGAKSEEYLRNKVEELK